MRAWVNGQLLERPDGPGGARSWTTGSRSATGCSRRSRSSTGSRSRSPGTSRGWRARPSGSACRRSTTREVRRGVAAVLDGFDEPLGRLRITYTGGPAPLGSGRGDEPPTLVVAAAPLGPSRGDDQRRRPCRGRATSAARWPGVKTTSYAENVVALAYASRARRHRGDLRQPARPPLRGHRLQRLLRARRRAADADPGVGLPGRHHPGADPRVVRRRRGRRADRGGGEQASEIFLASTTRDAQAVPAGTTASSTSVRDRRPCATVAAPRGRRPRPVSAPTLDVRLLGLMR